MLPAFFFLFSFMKKQIACLLHERKAKKNQARHHFTIQFDQLYLHSSISFNSRGQKQNGLSVIQGVPSTYVHIYRGDRGGRDEQKIVVEEGV